MGKYDTLIKNSYGLIPLCDVNNVKKPFLCIDSDGFYYNPSLDNLKKGRKPCKWKRNPRSTDNLSTLLELYDCEILNGERYNGSQSNFRYIASCGHEDTSTLSNFERAKYTGLCSNCAMELASKNRKTHGMTRTKFYYIYNSMKNRCENKKVKSYEHYGAVGINCSWKDFESFKKDMYKSYLKHYIKNNGDTTIDRICVLDDYSKSNCQWLTRSENTIKRNTIDKKYKEQNNE